MFGEGNMELTDTDNSQLMQSGSDSQSEGVRQMVNSEPLLTTSDEAYPIQSSPEDNNSGKVILRETVKYIDKPQRRITEIRVFYDDGTFDTFS